MNPKTPHLPITTPKPHFRDVFKLGIVHNGKTPMLPNQIKPILNTRQVEWVTRFGEGDEAVFVGTRRRLDRRLVAGWVAGAGVLLKGVKEL